MQAIRQAIQKHFFTLIMLMLAGGFTTLLAELLLTGHTDGTQLIAVVAAVAGVVLVFAAILVRGRAAVFVAVLLLLLSATGLIGTFQHLEEAGEERAAVPRLDQSNDQFVAYALDEDDDDAGKNESGGGETPPPLAPLSLAGLSLMALLATLGAPQKQVVG